MNHDGFGYDASMRTDDLDYELPPECIATQAAEPRDAAKLMVVHRNSGQVQHQQVRDLPKLGILQPGDLMIVNQTRVLKAWFEAIRQSTGGRVTGLFLEMLDADQARVMLETRGKLQPGETIVISGENLQCTLTLDHSQGLGTWDVTTIGDVSLPQALECLGQTPLPPYIRKARKLRHQADVTAADQTRYNTVYATDPGSVAAPTAGLHFTQSLLAELEAMNVRRAAVTLNVGVGTFAPVRTEQLDQHNMHRELFHVSQKTLQAIRDTRATGGRLFVVGTTSVRALESLPDEIIANPPAEGYESKSELFIHPDANFEFRFTDRLMTNFHLPRSTLLAMIATLPGVGLPKLKSLYETAITMDYRFYSYGDAMLFV